MAPRFRHTCLTSAAAVAAVVTTVCVSVPVAGSIPTISTFSVLAPTVMMSPAVNFSASEVGARTVVVVVLPVPAAAVTWPETKADPAPMTMFCSLIFMWHLPP
ncbi:hypothetical protein D3C86_1349000 [compost metagenome]